MLSCTQMLHMATESEVIQKLRYQVDNCDEELLSTSDQLSGETASDPHQHIQLCSPAVNQTTIDAYNVTLHQTHGIPDFLESLLLFFKRNNWELDIYSCKVSSNLRYFSLYANRTDNSLLLMSSHLWLSRDWIQTNRSVLLNRLLEKRRSSVWLCPCSRLANIKSFLCKGAWPLLSFLLS